MTISNASHIPSKIFRHAHHVVAIIGGATSITTISVRNENWNILPILRPAVGGKQCNLCL
jgi:hypothetical protein